MPLVQNILLRITPQLTSPRWYGPESAHGSAGTNPLQRFGRTVIATASLVAFVGRAGAAPAAGERLLTPIVEAQIGDVGLEQPILEGDFRQQSLWLGAEAGVSVRLSSLWSLRSTAGFGTFALSRTSNPGL